MQVEYATDILFKRQSDLQPLCEILCRAAIHAVKPANVATFLGRKLDDRFEGELGNNFQTRIEGTRIKHHMGRVSIKMCDKLGIEAIVAGEFTISGFRDRDLRDRLPGKSAGQIGRLIKCLRLHGLAKKVGKTYKYYLTKLGRKVVATALKMRRLFPIPALAPA